MPELPRFEDLRQDEVSKLIDYFLRIVVVATPLTVVATLAWVLVERMDWRSVTFVVLVAILTGTAIYLTRPRRRGKALPLRPSVLLVTAVLQLIGVFITGGIDSPFTPETIVTALLLALVLPVRWARAGVGMQIAVVAALTVGQATGVLTDAIPSAFGGGARVGTASLAWVRGAFLVGFLAFALFGGQRIKQAFEAIGRSALRSRDEALASHAEESRNLTVFVGEIAHELKNPLATIKGLSSLVASDLAEGKNAERLGFVRREADRMQTVLDEFLNFSRPVVPLSEHVVELGMLCQEVASLHEGLAGERDLKLDVSVPEQLEARCDRRKIKQVLINLVQNAIAASPSGERILLRAAAGDGDVVRIEVVDHGPGLAPEVAASVFRPGVTSKPGGTGFGLAVSRAIARQHGGELMLESTSGGCSAVLTLPSGRLATKGEAAA